MWWILRVACTFVKGLTSCFSHVSFYVKLDTAYVSEAPITEHFRVVTWTTMGKSMHKADWLCDTTWYQLCVLSLAQFSMVGSGDKSRVFRLCAIYLANRLHICIRLVPTKSASILCCQHQLNSDLVWITCGISAMCASTPSWWRAMFLFFLTGSESARCYNSVNGTVAMVLWLGLMSVRYLELSLLWP